MASRFGLSVALTTPFEASGQIAISPMITQTRACLGAGCSSA
ncbi:MAG: dihydrodipicolinate synthase family protein, partial [Mesorhizobium sp.]